MKDLFNEKRPPNQPKHSSIEITFNKMQVTAAQGLSYHLKQSQENMVLVVFLILITQGNCLLYPQNSETRQTISLDGVWDFFAGPEAVQGNHNQWYRRPFNTISNIKAVKMAVPSSYNDLFTDSAIRDYVGTVWYQRTFFVPKFWQNQLVWIRFGSVNYEATVWVNGHKILQHKIGHLPFEANITDVLNFGQNNLLTVSCNNELTLTTIPQGQVVTETTDSGEKKIQEYTFDFFNYAGIHRSVTLYTTPISYIDSIDIETDFQIDLESPENKTGSVTYKITTISNLEDNSTSIGVKLYDSQGTFITSQASSAGCLKIPNVTLWWPYLMDQNPAYLYTLEVGLLSNSEVIDIYRLQIGIRKIKWTNTSLTINDRPLYLTGFGRHEDHEIRGRGFDWASVIKDYDLILWTGANAYRTSHYPYAEEILDMADSLGILIIDECPAVNIDFVSLDLLENHKQSISELISRDKNRPSVIAWSVANEPRSHKNKTVFYWREIVNHAKMLDPTRPITASLNRNYSEDKLAQFLDVISFNRYNAWYRNEGHLDMITGNVVAEAQNWHETFRKPVLMSEYGADTLEGLHFEPSYIWSEEYQVDVLSSHFKAFDKLRRENDWFVGEFIWNFADFKTDQKITRVGGNKKGIFTRNRQPKAAGHHLRKRYFQLAAQIYGISLRDIKHFTRHNPQKYFINNKDEL